MSDPVIESAGKRRQREEDENTLGGELPIGSPTPERAASPQQQQGGGSVASVPEPKVAAKQYVAKEIDDVNDYVKAHNKCTSMLRKEHICDLYQTARTETERLKKIMDAKDYAKIIVDEAYKDDVTNRAIKHAQSLGTKYKTVRGINNLLKEQENLADVAINDMTLVFDNICKACDAIGNARDLVMDRDDVRAYRSILTVLEPLWSHRLDYLLLRADEWLRYEATAANLRVLVDEFKNMSKQQKLDHDMQALETYSTASSSSYETSEDDDDAATSNNEDGDSEDSEDGDDSSSSSDGEDEEEDDDDDDFELDEDDSSSVKTTVHQPPGSKVATKAAMAKKKALQK